MTLLAHLRPMPVFDAADAVAGGGGGGAAAAAAAAAKTALEAAGDEGAAGAGAGAAGAAGAGKDGAAGAQGGQQQPSLDAWRDMMAGDDEALKNELGRVKDLGALGKRFKDMREKLSKGLDPNEPMPEDPEKAKLWRQARGIPEKASEYKLPDTIKQQIRDVDKPIVDGFMEFMHKRNATQSQIDAGLEYYFGMEAATAADRAAADEVQKKETTSTLKEMWGADFKANAAIAKRAAEEVTPGVNWFDARLPDGRALGNIPEVSDLLVQLGLMKWGEGAYESGKGGSDAVGDELADLRKQMGDIKKWRTNKAGQARYLELMGQKEKRGGQ